MSNTVDFYDAAMVLWRTVTNIFFREIRPRGTFNIPREGPVIFVAGPHHNQFLDMLISLPVYRETGRKVRFIVAAKSMKHRYIGFFGRMLASIPVVRAQDEAKSGSGYISLSEDDPCLIIGHGTKFLSELSPKMQIMLPKSLGSSLAEVSEILSDTSLRIRKEFGGDTGKHTFKLREKVKENQATGKPGVEFKRIPHIDHQEMYQHVYECMKSGGCLGIFPEGGSHDRPELLPLKAGVALMALGAMASHPGLKVKIVPVGLSYFHAHKFRSRAVVEFGTPMEIPEALVDMYQEGGSQKRSAVAQLLNEISNALKTVTVTAPDYDTLMLIQAARRLYKSPGQQLTLGQVVELNKRFLFAYSHFKDEPKVIKLRDDVMRYNRIIRDLGLKDHQVPRARKNTLGTLSLLCYRLLLLSIWSCLALPGVILNAPIFLLASSTARQKAKDALAASSVKIAARDVIATWKILISMGLTPILYTCYAVIATVYMLKIGAPMKWTIWTPFLVVSILPMVAYAALKFGEAGMDVMKSLRPLVVALLPGQQKSLDRVKAMREHLSQELADAVNEFGPKLWDDFHKWRMVPPASAPPSSRPILGRNASSRQEAQGLLLSHPMTWLDEKLFGWNSGSNSQDTSRTGSPVGSEDEPDYDQFLLSLEGKTPAISRVGSYADLQRSRQSVGTGRTLKTSPIMTCHEIDVTGPEGCRNDDGLHMRTAHRNRRQSLSDCVPVQRIAQLGRRESFEEGAAELNREISMRKSQHEHQE